MALEKPDLKRCQALKPNENWSPMRLGPCPRFVRCENKPTILATEKKKGRDGFKGSMSLCIDCWTVMVNQMPGHATFKDIKEKRK